MLTSAITIPRPYTLAMLAIQFTVMVILLRFSNGYSLLDSLRGTALVSSSGPTDVQEEEVMEVAQPHRSKRAWGAGPSVGAGWGGLLLASGL